MCVVLVRIILEKYSTRCKMDRIAEPIVYNLDYIKEMDGQYEIVQKNDEKIIFMFVF